VAQFYRLPQDRAGNQHRNCHDHQPDDDLDGQQERTERQRDAHGRRPPELSRPTTGATLNAEYAEQDQGNPQNSGEAGAGAQRIG
jgi:hypothetical protein